jgi:guanine deaminase
VIDPAATPLLAMRTRDCETLEDLLAGLIFMGDDRAVERSFIAGKSVSSRD